MNKLFIITSSDDTKSFIYLSNELEKRNINYEIINDLNRPFKITGEEGVFRLSTGPYYKNIEETLIHYGVKGMITEKQKIEYNKIPCLSEVVLCKKKLEKKVNEELGGFPVVVKALGKMCGKGVMLIDSIISLYSIITFLISDDKKFEVKKFIKHNEQGRLVVLNNEVISSHANIISEKDYRSNYHTDRKRELRGYDDEVKKIAINALKARGSLMGGVDILINEHGVPYVAEVNSPCNWGISQSFTGINIAKKVVDFYF